MSILVISRDPVLFAKMQSALLPAELQLIHSTSLRQSLRTNSTIPQTVYLTNRLDRRGVNRIVRAITKQPRRLLIISGATDPKLVYQLIVQLKEHKRTITVLNKEILSTPQQLRTRLLDWYYSSIIRPDWRTLDIDTSKQEGTLAEVFRILEESPFRRWSVSELAQTVGISRNTLGRLLKAETGMTAKNFLMSLTYQLIEKHEAHGTLSSDIADLFSFTDVKQLHEWLRRYRSNH